MISITGGLQAMYNSNMREKTPLELEQELSQAKNRIRDLLKSETEYKLENERLNNIINEYDKYALAIAKIRDLNNSLLNDKNFKEMVNEILQILKENK